MNPDQENGDENDRAIPATDPDVTEPEDTHETTGLDLARTIARSMGAAAKNAPRAKRRPVKGDGPRRAVTPKVSGAHPDERDPQLLDATLGRLVADHGWTVDLKMHALFARWPDLVGAEVAQHCQPSSFVDGKLVVRTGSTAWATQLKLLAPTILRRLNEEIGHGSVTLIEIEGPTAPSWKKGRYSARDGRGPRDTYG